MYLEFALIGMFAGYLAGFLGIGGGFVVVWRSDGSPGTDTDGRSIQGRVLDADGLPSTPQFQVN